MLDFLVFLTHSTVPRKQRRLFMECHPTVIQKTNVLCSLLLGCFCFFCITKMSQNT